jgi:glucose/arabinose dehydrogenase
MRKRSSFLREAAISLLFLCFFPCVAIADERRTTADAFGDWRTDSPGVWRRLAPGDLPQPDPANARALSTEITLPPENYRPRAPEGFRVDLFAAHLAGPRSLRIAPNGDVFVVESESGAVRVLTPGQGKENAEDNAITSAIFASGFDKPSGLAFFPPGPAPEYIYVSSETQVVRFPYRVGDRRARAPAEIIVGDLPKGGHSTRDIAFSRDGKTLFIAIGSKTNVAEGHATPSPREIAELESGAGTGASSGPERDRAVVLAYDPQGRNKRSYATGLRNCAALDLRVASDELWCAVNERDLLGDNLPPDYATAVRPGAFYGWPWFYIGDHVDPRHAGARPDLATRVTTPDVLLTPHAAPVSIVFYDSAQFPAAFRGDAFVALHGSWNRSQKTGYKVVRLKFRDGKPTGEFEDFLVGFVLDALHVAGRPSALAVAPDGALLVGEDGNGAIWRVSFTGN